MLREAYGTQSTFVFLSLLLAFFHLSGTRLLQEAALLALQVPEGNMVFQGLILV
jgi:hypothetical protein